MPPDDPHCSMNEVWVNWPFSGEGNQYSGLAASPPLCLAMRTELHFSLGSSLDLVITVRGQAALGLWPRADAWARAVASHLGRGRRGCRRCLQPGRPGRIVPTAQHMEYFPDLLDLFHASIWKRVHGKHTTRRGLFTNNLGGNWTNLLSVTVEASHSDSFATSGASRWQH